MDRDHDFDDAIDTLATTVALSDGILHIRSKGIVSTDESVQQTVAASLRLTDGRRHPVLFDARIWPGGDPRGVDDRHQRNADRLLRRGDGGRARRSCRAERPNGRVCTDLDEARAFLEPHVGVE